MHPSSLRRSVAALLGALAVPAVLAGLPSNASAQTVFEDQGASKLPQGCNGGGCWTNYARVTDFDGDGDLDIIGVNCGGFFGTDPEPLLVWKNDGAGNFTNGNAALGSIVAPIRQIAVGDVDGDGDLDIYVPGAGGGFTDRLLVQTSAGVFEDQASTKLPAGLKSDAGFARMGDLDGDGDLDLVVGRAYSNNSAAPAFLYMNDGTGVFTASSTTYPQTMNGSNPDDVDLADVDGDFDLDILINAHNGQNSLWINDGAGSFTEGQAPPVSNNALHYGPVFCDVDGDGDLDFLVDNAAPSSSGREGLFLNDGSGHFTEATDQISGNPNSDDNLIECVDYDDDGDFDILIGALGTNERLFENDGTGHFSAVSGAEDGPTDSTLWMEAGDLDGDGKLDLFTGQGESGNLVDRVYFGGAGGAVDSHPPHLIRAEDPGVSETSPTPVRFSVSDNATTDEGPRLSEIYVAVGDQHVPAKFMGGDIFRAVVPATPLTSFELCATDLAGNQSCTPFELTPTMGEGGGGQGGASAGGGSQGGASSQGGHSEGGTSASGGGGADGGDSDDGCGCSVEGSASSSKLAALGLLGLALAARVSRRRAIGGGR